MARKPDQLLEQMVKKTVLLFEQGYTSPHVDDICDQVWPGVPRIPGMFDEIQARLPKLRSRLLEDDYDVVPLSQIFYTTYAGNPHMHLWIKPAGMKRFDDVPDADHAAITELNARRCTPIGRGRAEVGVMLLDDADPRSLDIWIAWNQLTRNQGAGKTRESNARLNQAVGNGLSRQIAIGIQTTAREIEGVGVTDDESS